MTTTMRFTVEKLVAIAFASDLRATATAEDIQHAMETHGDYYLRGYRKQFSRRDLRQAAADYRRCNRSQQPRTAGVAAAVEM